MTSVTRPSEPMRMNAFGANAGGAAAAAAVAAPDRSPIRQPSSSPPPVAVSTTTKSRRDTMCVVMSTAWYLPLMLRVIMVVHPSLGVPFVIHVFRVHVDDGPADPTGLRVPGYMITHRELPRHLSSHLTLGSL